MRARSVANKLRYRLYPGHCTGEKWGLGDGTAKDVHGWPVNGSSQEEGSWHQPLPGKAQEQRMHNCPGSSFSVCVKTSSQASKYSLHLLAQLDSGGVAGIVLEEGVLRPRSITSSVPRRSFQLWSHSCCEASEIVQNVEVNASNVLDLTNTVTGAAMSVLKKYLVAVKGASEADAEFVSRNCPAFLAKLAASVNIVALRKENPETLQSDLRSFIEKEDKEAAKELASFVSIGEVVGRLTLGDMVQLSRFPLALTGHCGLLKSVALLDSLGWSRHRLQEILEHNPQLLTWTAEELQANICILERVGVKRKDMLSFVEDSSVFTLDLEERLAPLLQYLKVIGIEWDVLGDLLKFNPQGLIKMPLANFRERVDFLLELGLSSSELERSMRVFPQLVHLRLANLTQKVEYFDGIGLDRDSMVKIVAKLPSIFRHSIEKNLVPKVQMLENIGVVKSHLVKFVAEYPQFFGCSMENLKQKLAFFEANGLTGERLVKMISWHPRAFSFSVDENLSMKLQFLVSKGFVVRSTAMVRALSSCITISAESLESRFQNLLALGFPYNDVCELVKKQPTIFCLSEKTIRGKLDYLVNTMNRSSTEILKCPGYLLYSLDLRIKPRHRVLALLTSKGLLREDGYSLSTILQPSEKTFVERFVDRDPECSHVYLDRVGETDGNQALKVDQLASVGLLQTMTLQEHGNLAHPFRI